MPTVLYFAYGSNMDTEELRRYCPSARCERKPCLLRDYRLEFTRYSCRWGGGVADIVRRSGDEVWGVIYEVEEQDLPNLDRKEGYCPGRSKNAYRRIEVVVLEDGDEQRRLTVFTYEVESKSASRIPPSNKYKSVIVNGARFWGLREHYVRKLEGICTREEGQGPT